MDYHDDYVENCENLAIFTFKRNQLRIYRHIYFVNKRGIQKDVRLIVFYTEKKKSTRFVHTRMNKDDNMVTQFRILTSRTRKKSRWTASGTRHDEKQLFSTTLSYIDIQRTVARSKPSRIPSGFRISRLKSNALHDAHDKI